MVHVRCRLPDAGPAAHAAVAEYSQNTVYLLSSLMAFAACASALLELGLLTTQSLETYRLLIRWENLTIFMMVPMVWFVQGYFNTARRWLALTITLLWGLGMLINFVSPWSLTFSTVAGKPLVHDSDTDAHGLSDLGNRLAQLQDTMY